MGEGIRVGRWKRGHWTVVFKSGARITFEGRVRLSHNSDGYVCDVDLDSPDLIFYAGYDSIEVVFRTAGIDPTEASR